MTFSILRFRVTDGLILGELPMVSLSWARVIRDGQMNAPKSTRSQTISSITWPVSALEEAGVIDRSRTGWQSDLSEALMPTKVGLALCWDGTPIIMGPIASPRKTDGTSVQVTVDGISTLLSSRFVVPEDFSATAKLSFSGLSLGTIAKRAVQQGLAKPGGGLPITFDDDQTATDDADHKRTYNAYNIANLSVSHVLELLSQVTDGPDIEFRPEIVDDQHLGWHMYTGTEQDPYIRQSVTPTFEEGGDGVESVSVETSTEYLAFRVYGTGDGTDEGTRVVKVDGAQDALANHWPLIEVVESDTDWNTDPLLLAHAKTFISETPLQQVTMTVRADGPTPLGRFWPGMMCQVTLHDQADVLPGTYPLRIQSMSGDATNSVKLVFDPTDQLS